MPGNDAGACGPAPLRSVHTSTLAELLESLASSLLVTTYQAGKLVVVRAQGASVNTHFRVFDKPMGLALGPDGRLGLGCRRSLVELRNLPAAAARLDPPGRHDACFLPRRSFVTGDVDVHELAYAGDELWLVNTRFSCLCTLDGDHSFVPRWRPPFVTALSPEDRCHLNGLCVRDDRPRFVTALGSSDVAQGWRSNKAKGGVVVDVDSGELVARGLSMPHSPRWHADRLWVLESGCGGLATVEPGSGRVETVARLPGFTRGLAFAGRYAFVGLSQVRESNVFAGLPITEHAAERNCGVWVVDVERGQTVAFLRFEDAVQEIFAVELLHGVRYPDVLEPGDDLLDTSWCIPDEALADVPELLRTS